MNDFIQPDLCSLQYVHVDDVIQKLVDRGPGAVKQRLTLKLLIGWFQSICKIAIFLA